MINGYGGIMIIRWLVKEYESNGKVSLNNYFKRYSLLKNINEVIECATLAKLPKGKKHIHQRRLNSQVMESVKNKLLLRSIEIQSSLKFDDIFNIVNESSEKGFKDLAIYDTALRIGAFLNVYPVDIYLHAGTLEGAKSMGLNTGIKKISLSNTPKSLKSLKAYEIEDFLCIYKVELKNLNSNIKFIRLNENYKAIKA